ncbi:MAG: Trm112 family protein [Candidatus Eisenbacteria bacterium]|nr:Trm112 family protein [Candidatus Eisenbacteria bacterium]
MLAKELLDILVCPQCKGDLEYDPQNQKLICHACRLRYPIQDDIPIMLVEEAEPLDADSGPRAPRKEG